MLKSDVITDLNDDDAGAEINEGGDNSADSGKNVNLDHVNIPERIMKIVNEAKELKEGPPEKELFKVICGERPYNKNAVSKDDLYKNGIAFIVDDSSPLSVPCSLLRVYSLFFQSTDSAVKLICGLHRGQVSHQQFAKYLYIVHGIMMINCFPTYDAKETNLSENDFENVEEVLFVGKKSHTCLADKIPKAVKSGTIIHSSGLVYNANQYFATWHLYQDSSIQNNKGITLNDFKIFDLDG